MNKVTALQRAGALASGLPPLDYLLKTMRSPEPKRFDGESITMFSARYRLWSEQCVEAAKAAAPYVHPRLAPVEHSGPNGGKIEHHLIVEFVE